MSRLNRYSVVLALLFCNPSIAAHTSSTSKPKTQSINEAEKVIPKVLSFEEFVQWLLEHGKDKIDNLGRNAEPLKLPPGGLPAKAWATGNTNPYHKTSLILNKTTNGKDQTPICLILSWSKEYPKLLKSKHYGFRFSLDGTFERGTSTIGDRDSNGKPIRSSGIIAKLDLKDPEIQEKAQAELDFWLKRAAELIAKKKSRN